MGKKKRKDLIEENLTNTDVGFGEMAIQQTITNCSDIGKNTDAIVERIGAKLDRLIEWHPKSGQLRKWATRANFRSRPATGLQQPRGT